MRNRLAVLSILLLVLSATLPSLTAPAIAAPTVFAQDDSGAGGGDPTDQGDEAEGGETGDQEGSGQSDPEAETGAGEDAEEGSTPTGPPWTYQMARLALGLLVLMGLAMALA